MLDPNVLKPFWVTWVDGSVSLGKDALGTNLLVELEVVKDYPLEYMRFECFTLENDCDWRFGQEQGKVLTSFFFVSIL